MRGTAARAWRRWRQLGGDFAEPESSARARSLTARWHEVWPDAEPLGHMLRRDYPGRWVRFHSLPGSKRYADTPAESDVILDRHLTVLRELIASEEPRELVLIAEEWGPDDLAGGWTRNTVVEWWPWRTYAEPSEDGFPPSKRYFWVGRVTTLSALEPLLRLAADDKADFVIAPPSLDWIYAPYDGGADILLTDASRRDALAATHSGWLSPRPDGL